VGVSDTPAWKIAQANVIAQFRGWSQFIGLQIEYSLLERSVEQELVPMALELALGITPWSPLKSGLLSGKYTRASAATPKADPKADRSALMGNHLNETTYRLLDELATIAAAHGSTVARVALAWVRGRPGVSSTIIGARRISQLEDNLKSLDLTLSAADLAHLDSLTKPSFGFPQSMQPVFPAIHNGGTMVNGVHAPASPFILQEGEKPY
jgi:aryl-alcohol dehydrogenase-like predicted oxidoreductase